jgi:hypothetical protein
MGVPAHRPEPAERLKETSEDSVERGIRLAEDGADRVRCGESCWRPDPTIWQETLSPAMLATEITTGKFAELARW